MENLEINKTAKELAEEAIRSDIEHIKVSLTISVYQRFLKDINLL